MSDEDPYTMRQDRKDARYAKEYQAWIASLSPEEQRDLAKRGLDKPSIPGYSSGTGMTRDAAESSVSTYQSSPEDEDEDEKPKAKADISSNQIWDIMRRLVGELVQDKNPGLTMDCATLVAGLVYKGNTMTEIAMKHGTTRAAVSKRCIELTDTLGLKPSRAMRSMYARKSYQKARNQSVLKQKQEIYGNRNHGGSQQAAPVTAGV
jgi:hypothetical protein